MKFQLLIKIKMLKNKLFSPVLKLLVFVFIMLINVKMPTLIGIITLKSLISCLVELSIKKFYNLIHFIIAYRIYPQ